MRTKRACRPWLASEERYVREHYHRMPTAMIAAHLKRTVWAVKQVARRLGVTRPNHAPFRWTARRWAAFHDAYRRDPAEAARLFGLTRMTANSYASRYGFQIRRSWTPAEDAALRELWPHHRDVELRSRLQQRSDRSIRARAFKLGLRRPAIHEWTKWRFAS